MPTVIVCTPFSDFALTSTPLVPSKTTSSVLVTAAEWSPALTTQPRFLASSTVNAFVPFELYKSAKPATAF